MTWVFASLVLFGLVGALITYKVSGSLATIAAVERTHTLQPKTELLATAPLPAPTRPGRRGVRARNCVAA